MGFSLRQKLQVFCEQLFDVCGHPLAALSRLRRVGAPPAHMQPGQRNRVSAGGAAGRTWGIGQTALDEVFCAWPHIAEVNAAWWACAPDAQSAAVMLDTVLRARAASAVVFDPAGLIEPEPLGRVWPHWMRMARAVQAQLWVVAPETVHCSCHRRLVLRYPLGDTKLGHNSLCSLTLCRPHDPHKKRAKPARHATFNGLGSI